MCFNEWPLPEKEQRLANDRFSAWDYLLSVYRTELSRCLPTLSPVDQNKSILRHGDNGQSPVMKE